jgi:RNA polymerase primary sigma factor
MSMRQLKITKSITNRESQSLEKYLQEINKLKLISAEEEVRLAELIKKGDKKAFDYLVKANLRFVVSVAKQYQHQGISLSDLINEGNMGLMKAARSFDATRGFKFISYAVWWIRQHIVKALADDGRMVRLPLNKIALRNCIQKTSLSLEQKFERTATAEELAEEMNMELEEINSSLSMGHQHISLDTPLSEDGEDSMLDVLANPNAANADEELINSASLKTEIDRSFQMLTRRQKETICYFFGIGTSHAMGLDDIADKFGLTRERVRQIKEKALAILRATNGFHLLRSYTC